MSMNKEQLLASLGAALENAPEEVIAMMGSRLEQVMGTKPAAAPEMPAELAAQLEAKLAPGRKLYEISVIEMLQNGEYEDDDDRWENLEMDAKMYWNALVTRLGIDMSKVKTEAQFDAFRKEMQAKVKSGEGKCNCAACQMREALEKQQG